MPNWKEIRKEWETSKITFRALAEKHGVKEGTLKSRRSREGWSRDPTKKDATIQGDATQNTKRMQPQRKQAAQGNRSGNPNPENQFTKRNRAAMKHGFFSKYIPDETLEIMDSVFERDPANLIWDQIQIQYAAIIRAQRIMYVADQDDMTKELKKESYSSGQGGSSSTEEYEIQFAWDKHASFLNAQSRAMSEFRSLIKQFCEMAHENDERRLKLEQMQLGIEKSKLEISQIRGDTEGDPHDQVNSYEEALNAQADDVFSDDEVINDEEA